MAINSPQLGSPLFLLPRQRLQVADEEIEKMAAIAEQEKLRNITMEKQLQALGPLSSFPSACDPAPDLQQALQDKDK